MTDEQMDGLGAWIEDVERTARAEQQIEDAKRDRADDRGGDTEPAALVNDELHVDGRYFARSEDADFWRGVRDERRRRTLQRIAKYEANDVPLFHEAAD